MEPTAIPVITEIGINQIAMDAVQDYSVSIMSAVFIAIIFTIGVSLLIQFIHDLINDNSEENKER